jgi:ankyrin repeat protein
MAAVLTRNYHQIEELRRKDRSTELLFAASRSGRIDVVRYLASRGVDMDVIHPELGLAPLSVAIGSGCELMVRTLVELGADVNLQYSAGVTPLWTAAMDGSEPLVRVMLELGADPTLGRSNFGDLASTLSAVGMPRMAKLINEATRHGDAP